MIARTVQILCDQVEDKVLVNYPVLVTSEFSETTASLELKTAGVLGLVLKFFVRNRFCQLRTHPSGLSNFTLTNSSVLWHSKCDP